MSHTKHHIVIDIYRGHIFSQSEFFVRMNSGVLYAREWHHGGTNAFTLNPDLFKLDMLVVRKHGHRPSVFLILVIRELHFVAVNPEYTSRTPSIFHSRRQCPAGKAERLFHFLHLCSLIIRIQYLPAVTISTSMISLISTVIYKILHRLALMEHFKYPGNLN